jgi:Protease II
MPAPIAKKIPTTRTFHGDSYVDNYEWLRDKNSYDVLDLLEAENAWTAERTAHIYPLQEAIVDEIASRTRENDTTAPVRQGDWWYVTRTWEGKQYPATFRLPINSSDPARRPVFDGSEHLVWDGNSLGEGAEFFAISSFAPSPDGRLGALGVDFTGDEHFRLRIFDIETGAVIDDAVSGLGYGLAWTSDSNAVVYSRVDDSWRMWQIWLHRIGSPTWEDKLLFQEDDERFEAFHWASRDGRWIVVRSTSTSTSEVLLYDVAHIDNPPIVVCPRRQGLDYSVEPADDLLLIVHNANVPDFEVAYASVGQSGPEEWTAIFTPEAGERVVAVDAFRDFAVISMRSGGQPQLRSMLRSTSSEPSTDQSNAGVFNPHNSAAADSSDKTARSGKSDANGSGLASLAADPQSSDEGAGARAPRSLPWTTPAIIPSEPLASIEVDENYEWEACEVVCSLQSLLTPPTQFGYAPVTGEKRLLKELEVPNYDRDAYTQEGVWVETDDGALVPMTVVHRADLKPDYTNPGYIYGYGSYEISMDPVFRPSFISILQRGVVVAFAHPRGGGEMGRAWYEEGRLLKKRNTFTDFIACARWLRTSGWVAEGRLAAEGRSAGGLLMGAVANLAPSEFRAIHAGVPFVDALTTILKPELPLTVGEWEEWGNPIESEEVYRYMQSYSPTENVGRREYPAILATTSLNDIRVLYVEPTKWVQILRDRATNDPIERPILEKIEMVAGHGGKSGRYDAWRERAFEIAWMLDQLGVS